MRITTDSQAGHIITVECYLNLTICIKVVYAADSAIEITQYIICQYNNESKARTEGIKLSSYQEHAQDGT